MMEKLFKNKKNVVESGIDNDGNRYIVVKPTLERNTATCNHYFVPAGKKEKDTGLYPYSCRYCGKGVLVHKRSEVKDGKLLIGQ